MKVYSDTHKTDINTAMCADISVDHKAVLLHFPCWCTLKCHDNGPIIVHLPFVTPSIKLHSQAVLSGTPVIWVHIYINCF